jgi:hypothetical protein
MTRVGRSTSGFIRDAPGTLEQKLTEQHHQKGPFGTLPSSDATDISLPSDVAAALSFARTLLAGVVATQNTECQPQNPRRESR